MNTKWKTKNGDILDIFEMKTSHIINVINLLDRREPLIKRICENDLSKETMDMLSESDLLPNDNLIDFYENINLELSIRKLEGVSEK